MNLRAAMMMAAAALGWTAQGAAAEPTGLQYSPRILAPGFAESRPRHLQKHVQAQPLPDNPRRRHPRKVVAVPVLVPVYVEPAAQYEDPAESPAQGQSPYWYFCPDSQGYYPDVAVCASGWLALASGTARRAY